MSEKGHKAALQLNFSPECLRIIQEALLQNND